MAGGRLGACVVVVLLGCQGGESPAAAPSGLGAEERDEIAPTRASRETGLAEEVVAGPADVAPAIAPVAPIEPTAPDAPASPIGPGTTARPLLSLRFDVDVEEAENGSGAVVPATNPVAFDLDARRFPPGARDPVLFVGPLRFVHYAHPVPGVLRFVCADRALLPQGREVSVRYGDEEDTRVVVSRSLEVGR